jgi:hypothetical protein
MITDSEKKPEGLDVWNTGGGCRAYGRVYPNGSRTLVTDEGGTELPTSGRCLIVPYGRDEEVLDKSCVHTDHQMEKTLSVHEELSGQCTCDFR